jgi:hypothetical protein
MTARRSFVSLALLSALACDSSTGPRADYSTVVLADGPLAYWRFEETADVIANDSSGNGRSGAYAPDATHAASVGIARLGRAVLLQTPSDGVVSDASAWSNVATVSAEAWIRPDSVTSPEGMIIIDKGEVWNLAIDPQGKPAFHLVLGNVWVSAPDAVQAGRTYHLIGTFESRRAKLYVNGELARDSTTSFDLDTRDKPVHVGTGLSPVWFEFYGVIDEVAIYDKVLSADAVLRHYNAGR